MTPLIDNPGRKTLRNRSARQRAREKVKLGLMLCACGNVGVKIQGGSTICERCADIERRLTVDYSKNHRGRGDKPVPAVMPYAVHCGME